MIVYLAARYSRKAEMRRRAEELREAGFEVSSRWLDSAIDSYETATPADLQTWAEKDLEDVWGSDALILFSEPHGPSTSCGGRHVEFGIALAGDLHIIVVGERENVFHWHPGVLVRQTWEGALALLQEIRDNDAARRNLRVWGVPK